MFFFSFSEFEPTAPQYLQLITMAQPIQDLKVYVKKHESSIGHYREVLNSVTTYFNNSQKRTDRQESLRAGLSTGLLPAFCSLSLALSTAAFLFPVSALLLALALPRLFLAPDVLVRS